MTQRHGRPFTRQDAARLGRRAARGAIAGLGIASLLAAGTAIAQEPKFFRIASGSAGGTYYPMAGLIGNAVSNPPGSRPCEEGGSCGVPGLVAVAQSANGSVANVNSIQSGAVESGFVQSDVAYWSYNAEGLFEGEEPFDKLRFIASLYPEHIHVYTRADSDIESVADLEGKTVNIGLPASGAKVGATLILEAYGLVENEDYEAEYSNTAQAGQQIRDGQIDASLTVTGYPSAGISEVASTAGIKLIPIDQEHRDIVKEKAPFYSDAVIPAGAYEGVDYDTETVAVEAQWLVSADIDEELVYQITKALWNDNSRELLDKGLAKGKAVTRDTALEARGIPFHPGAERFYREAGMIE
jgi:TRAP transporter TAXI family solute receptor